MAQNEGKRNAWLEKAEFFLSFFSVSVDVIFGLLGLQFGIINIFVFTLFAIVCLVVWICLTVLFNKKEKEEEKEYKRQKKQYIKHHKKHADIIYKKIEEYFIERKREKRRYTIITVFFGIGIIFNCVMIVLQWNEMRGVNETGKVPAGINVGSNENTTTVETTIVNEGDGSHGITQEERKEMENKTFILTEPEKLEVLLNTDEDRVFYVTMDQGKIKEEVEEHISSIYHQKKRSAISEESAEKRLVTNAQSAEDDFLDAIDKAKECKLNENYESWKSVIPNSNTLDNIMKDREFLLEQWGKDMDVDGVLCIRLANNNKLLADEYRCQGGKPETVVYYYVETIKRTEDGLAYEDIPEAYKTEYYRYLKARYKDIADYIEDNLDRFGVEEKKYQQLKEKANAIYKAM